MLIIIAPPIIVAMIKIKESLQIFFLKIMQVLALAQTPTLTPTLIPTLTQMVTQTLTLIMVVVEQTIFFQVIIVT